jgi:hypothetical protein
VFITRLEPLTVRQTFRLAVKSATRALAVKSGFLEADPALFIPRATILATDLYQMTAPPVPMVFIQMIVTPPPTPADLVSIKDLDSAAFLPRNF